MAVLITSLSALASFASASTADTFTAPVISVQSGTDKKPADADASSQTVLPAPLSRDQKLDKLFSDLRKTADESKALGLASQINSLWAQSGSATVDLMMQWANAAIIEKKYPVASDFLDEAIALDPDYAEAWNHRATLHFLMRDYTRAMYDINRTLALEPRHYGALTGMAAILQERGLKEPALRAYERALAVYPMLRDAQKKAGELTDELTDTRT